MYLVNHYFIYNDQVQKVNHFTHFTDVDKSKNVAYNLHELVSKIDNSSSSFIESMNKLI
jgi:hypothetical protein